MSDERRRFSSSAYFKLWFSVSFEALLNLLGFYSLNMRKYQSLSFLHEENTVNVVVIVVVVLAGKKLHSKIS